MASAGLAAPKKVTFHHLDLSDGGEKIHAHVKLSETEVEIAAFSLKVLVVKDGSLWFAHGLDVDYAASGPDPDKAKSNFAKGLAMTIESHLKLYGDVKKISSKKAPTEVWDEYKKVKADNHLKLAIFKVTKRRKNIFSDLSDLAFEGINFIQKPEAEQEKPGALVPVAA